jgi:diguanylate cyclase (GGDEF)-like protein/PAS domain S-box-containing protein
VQRFRHYLLAFMVFAASTVATGWIWQHERHNAELDRRAELDFSLREIASSIEQRLASYEQVLQGVRSFIGASDPIESQPLQAYLAALQLGADYAGLEELHVVPLAHPPAPLDPYADGQQRAAMDAARDSGRLTMTGKRNQTSASADLSQVSVVLFLALYQGGGQPSTLAQRRARLAGWVMAPVKMGQLMASLYGQHALQSEIKIHDGVQMSQASLMFDSTVTGEPPAAASTEVTEYLVLAGQTWAVTARSRAAGVTPSGKDSSALIALGGGGMTLLMTVLAWMLVTRRERAEATATEMTAELREVRDRLELILNTSPDAVVLIRWDDGTLVDANQRFAELTGFKSEDWVGRQVSDMHIWVDPHALQEFIGVVGDKGVYENFEANFHTKDGTQIVCLVSGKRLLIRGVAHVLSIARDISERKEIELRITHMAQHDPLTGLPNRAMFYDRLQQELAHAKRDRTRLALMFIDLDRFKPVNDTWGHAVGDVLLKEVAIRIVECVRQSDTVGRIGGDEFVVLLPLIKDDSDALGVALKIRQTLELPFIFPGGIAVQISCSNGIAFYPEHGDDEIELSKNADAAMYLAKERGRNRVEIFSSATGSNVPVR